MYRASSEARNATAAATSPGSPSRPNGVRPQTYAADSASWLRSPGVPVMTLPGATALQRTPSRPCSTATWRVSWTSPPLLTA